MKKASAVLFILIVALLGFSACNSAARKAKKCDCPRFGQQAYPGKHPLAGKPG